jgi:hypothetical protein
MGSAPKAADVGVRTAWKSTRMPELGLQLDLNFEYRVYALECAAPAGQRGPHWYVGIEHKSGIGKRMVKHFGGGGASYTKSLSCVPQTFLSLVSCLVGHS